MARIQLADLPRDMKISPKDMQKVRGGALIKPLSLSIFAAVDGESTDANHEKWIDVLGDSDDE